MRTLFPLELKEVEHPLGGGWKTFELASTVTGTSVSRGTQWPTAPYYLQPIQWVRKAIDGAKENLRFLETVRQETLPTGNNEMVIPKRKRYMDDSDWETSSEEYTTADTDVLWTDITTPDGVAFVPVDKYYGVSITEKNIRVNALNQVQYCREELAYKYENTIDSDIRNQTMGDSNSTEANVTAAPTPSSNTVNGATTILGGSATMADDSLADGDVLTTDIIRDMIRHLSSKTMYYWSSTTAFTKSAVTKNPWNPSATEPFVLYIAPEQRKALQGESQFVNAAEYGSDKVVLTGEIGEYLGVKIINTTKCTSFTDGDYVYLDGTINPLMNTDGHIAMMVKAMRYAAIVWAEKPSIRVFNYPSQPSVRMVLHMAYKADEVHPDGIVRAIVSDA